jgi:hypothetical protein
MVHRPGRALVLLVWVALIAPPHAIAQDSSSAIGRVKLAPVTSTCISSLVETR